MKRVTWGRATMSSFLVTCGHLVDKRDESCEAIFFTETSVTGSIRPRFVCAVESAARAYPGGDIYLLVSYIPAEGLLKSANEALKIVLDNYKNVHGGLR